VGLANKKGPLLDSGPATGEYSQAIVSKLIYVSRRDIMLAGELRDRHALLAFGDQHLAEGDEVFSAPADTPRLLGRPPRRGTRFFKKSLSSSDNGLQFANLLLGEIHSFAPSMHRIYINKRMSSTTVSLVLVATLELGFC
jgi:hypothetical protein